ARDQESAPLFESNRPRRGLQGGFVQRFREWRSKQEGKLGYILLWALGVPIPVLFVIYLLRGCN
ncbi:MAG TPA: hypothetical protein VGP71_10065, partial [Burkholderiales bacterium]|nr:hypothetical protein [Burkholderiales bacterium]